MALKTKVDANTVFHISACNKIEKKQDWLAYRLIQKSEYFTLLFWVIEALFR